MPRLFAGLVLLEKELFLKALRLVVRCQQYDVHFEDMMMDLCAIKNTNFILGTTSPQTELHPALIVLTI